MCQGGRLITLTILTYLANSKMKWFEVSFHDLLHGLLFIGVKESNINFIIIVIMIRDIY